MDRMGVEPITPTLQESVAPTEHASPFVSSGSRGTRTHKRRLAATCFQDRLLIRPDDFRSFISCFTTALRSVHEIGRAHV